MNLFPEIGLSNTENGLHEDAIIGYAMELTSVP
jgi:hypothetical protein